MKKQELIHLHALGGELYAFVSTPHGPEPGPFEAYERAGVTPVAFHYDKSAHKRATFRLLAATVEVIDAETVVHAGPSP